MKNHNMTEGRPWVSILYFVFPILLGLLLQQLYNTVDTIIVGNFSGEEALSAVGTTGSLTYLALAFATGFSSGNGIVISQYYGAGDEKKVRENASVGILLLMMLSIIITLIGIISSRFIFRDLIDVPDSILDLTLTYFNVYMLGMVFQFGYNIIAAILRAVGDSAATLYFLIVASIINVGLDILFVAVFKMSVLGAAIATDIAQALSFLAAFVYMWWKYPIFRFRLNEYVWKTKLALKTLTTGFPITLQMIVISVGLTLIQKVINGFGQEMIAAATVGQRIETYMNLPCTAFQTTLATYTGQNIGAGKMERVKKGSMQGVLLSVGITLIISVLTVVYAKNLSGLFGLGSRSIDYSIQYLQTIAITNILLAIYKPLYGTFQGANHTSIPMIMATIALIIRVGVSYLFRYSPFFGYTIIWWNGVFGFGAACVFTWLYYLSDKWKENSLITE